MSHMPVDQAATLATATGPHLFWLASRAAGIAALVLSSLSVSVGLLMGGRFVKRRGTDLKVTHEALSLATLAALVVHGVSLIGDSYLHPSLADVAVPFLSGYKTLWTSSGIVAFWALAILGLSYMRGRASAPALAQAAPLRGPRHGCSASRTRWARAPTPDRRGSWQ